MGRERYTPWRVLENKTNKILDWKIETEEAKLEKKRNRRSYSRKGKGLGSVGR